MHPSGTVEPRHTRTTARELRAGHVPEGIEVARSTDLECEKYPIAIGQRPG